MFLETTSSFSLPYFPDILPFYVKMSEHQRYMSITFNSSEKVNFGDSIMKCNFMISDNRVLMFTLQLERNKVSEKIRGVHITCWTDRTVISEATVGQKWNARVILNAALVVLNFNLILTLLNTPWKRKYGDWRWSSRHMWTGSEWREV